MNIILGVICVFALGVPVLSRGKKSINLALETSVLFEPQDAKKHLDFINDARKFLDTLEEAIMPKKILRGDTPKHSLTDFMSRLADTILHLYEEDLETLFKVLENEMKSQFLKGSIFRDIVYDPKLQTFFRNKLKEWANTDPRQMKAKLRQYMAKDANDNDTLHELGRFLNDYYGREQEFKMEEIIKRLGRTLDESEISIIVRDALNTLVLQHYDKMNYTTRAKLVEKINAIKHEYFTSHVDHDLMLTFRRKDAKPKESNSLEDMDAWLLKLERKGVADRDIDLSDVEIQDPAEDKYAPVLTLDDWDNWLNKRNKKGIRKVNTLMSETVEEMIKAAEDSEMRHKSKEKYKDKGDSKSGDNKIDEPIDELENFRARADSKLLNNNGFRKINTLLSETIEEMTKTADDSEMIHKSKKKYKDKPVKVRGTGDSKSGDSKSDEPIGELEDFRARADSKLLNKNGFRKINTLMSETIEEMTKTADNSKIKHKSKEKYKDKPVKVRVAGDSKSGDTKIDKPIDELENLRARADSKLLNKNGFRKINTLMSETIEEMTKTADNSKIKHKSKEKYIAPVKVRATGDLKSGENENDQSIDQPEKFKAGDSILRSYEINESTDKPERVKTKAMADSKLESNENDESTGEIKMINTSDFKFRKNDADISLDQREKVKTTADPKLSSIEIDESTDEPGRAQTTADFKPRKSKFEKPLDKPKKVNAKHFKSKHRHKQRKDKPVKFKASGNFIFGNDHNEKYKLKKVEDTADFNLRKKQYELSEHESETTGNKGLTTVEVFSQLYGIKPNKELIVDKDLEIYVGGFGATLVGKDKNYNL